MIAITDEERARIEKLPKWARDLFTRLHRNAARNEQKLREISEGAETCDWIADPYSDHPVPISGDCVRGHLTHGRITFTLHGDFVDVLAHTPYGEMTAIESRSGNAFRIHLLEAN